MKPQIAAGWQNKITASEAYAKTVVLEAYGK